MKPGKGAATGAALNAGVITLTKGLAGDLAEKKIRVNVVVPGLVKTELWGKMGRTEEQQKEQFEKTTLPVGFVATPDDIAEAYLYLVKADFATGTSVEIGEFSKDGCVDELSSLTIFQMVDLRCEGPLMIERAIRGDDRFKISVKVNRFPSHTKG